MTPEEEEAEKCEPDRGQDQEKRGRDARDARSRLAFGLDAIAGNVTAGAGQLVAETDRTCPLLVPTLPLVVFLEVSSTSAIDMTMLANAQEKTVHAAMAVALA